MQGGSDCDVGYCGGGDSGGGVGGGGGRLNGVKSRLLGARGLKRNWKCK